MKSYPDTSYLCAVYREQDNTARADAFNADLEEPLPISSLLLLAFRQSMRLQARLFVQDRSRGFPKAIHFGTEQFLTFDVNQRKLAEAEGMMAPL
jgi:hypothetical protein